MKKQVKATLLAWLLFIGVDFLFHASLLAAMWEEDITLFKSAKELTILIPIGYTSFLLLTMLIGYVFFNFFKSKPPLHKVLRFGLIFGTLFSVSNALGLYSYVTIPAKHLILFNLVYFLEIMVVALSFYFYMFTTRPKKVVVYSILTFFLCLIVGVLIQNIM